MRIIINMLVIVLVVGALFFGYRLLTGGEAVDEGPLVEEVPASEVAAGQALSGRTQVSREDFLSLLTTVNGIDFSKSVFHDDVFKELYNFQEPLPEREAGRLNPFAPVGASAGASATSSRTNR